MLAFEGNTAPYMQYAYAAYSVFRKANIDESVLANATVTLTEDREAQLAARLLQFEETLSVVARDGTPHVMCAYLWRSGRSVLYSYYEHCPILSAERSGASQPPEAGAADGEPGWSGYPGYRNRRTCL